MGYRDKDHVKDPLDCGNWGIYFKELNTENLLYWINNGNSVPPSDYVNSYVTKTKDLRNFNLNHCYPDEIILCLSPQWVPPIYQSLFLLWLDILNNYYDTHFDFED